MDDHEGQGVARDGPLAGILDVPRLGPLLDKQDQGRHAPVHCVDDDSGNDGDNDDDGDDDVGGGGDDDSDDDE